MRLAVRGMDKAEQRFVHLWGMYVSGFKPEKHCLACLVGKSEPDVNRDMKDDENIPLRHANEFRHFYLFAGGRAPQRDSNVHLVVEHRPGAVASVGSLYGVTFTIYDALAIRILPLPKGSFGKDESYTNCKNFQFGVQTYGYHLKESLPSVEDSELAADLGTLKAEPA